MKPKMISSASRLHVLFWALLLAVSFECRSAQQQPSLTVTTTTSNPSTGGASTLISNLLREQATLKQQQQQQLAAVTTQQQFQSTTTGVPIPAGSSPSVDLRAPAQTTLATTTTTETRVPSSSESVTASVPQQTSPIDPTTVAVGGENKFQFMRPQRAKCTYNNETYSVGDKWNDDCLHVCECVPGVTSNLPAISACRPRCPTYKDPPGDSCKLQRSKLDECCLEFVCDLEAKFAPVANKSAVIAHHHQPTTTVVQTEFGQLNVSTTEIKMPSLETTTTTTTTTAAPTTTTTTTTTTTPTPSTTVAPSVSLSARTLVATSQSAAPTTTTTQPRTTTQRSRNAAATSTTPPAGQRSGKRVNDSGARSAQSVVPPTVVGPPILRDYRTLADITSEEPRIVNEQPIQTTTRTNLNMLKPVTSTTTTTTTTPTPFAGEEVDPSTLDLCIDEIDNGYKLNQSFQVDRCNQTCRCVFRDEPRDPFYEMSYIPTLNLKPNSSLTEIRCTWPAQCLAKLNRFASDPSLCAHPQVRLPSAQELRSQDASACLCPKVDCAAPTTETTSSTVASNRAPARAPVVVITTTERMPTTQMVRGCQSRQQGGTLLAFGDTFNDECHSTCRCEPNGEIRCEPMICPELPAPDSICAEWQFDPFFRPNTSERKCCPQFVCKRPASQPETKGDDANDQLQSSTAAEATTQVVPQMKSCTILSREVFHGHQVPEEIQPHDANLCEKVCICNNGTILCQPLCPPIGDLPPEDLGCAAKLAYQTRGDCCPRWSCPIKEDYALRDFSAEPVNATTAEVSIMLPLFALGHRGKAELNFTGVPNSSPEATSELPPANAQWTRRSSIRTVDGTFSSQLIKYYLNDLRPNHKYWLRMYVRIYDLDQPPFDSPIESPIQTIQTPASVRPLLRQELADNEFSADPMFEPAPTPCSGGGGGGSSQRPSSAVPSSVSPATTTTQSPSTRTILQPIVSSHSSSAPSSTTATTITTSTTSTTTTQAPTASTTSVAPPGTRQPTATEFVPSEKKTSNDNVALKGDVSQYDDKNPHSHDKHDHTHPPYSRGTENNHIDLEAAARLPLPWTDQIQLQMNAPLQRYAWHLLVAFSVMTILFAIVSYLYLKKSSRVVAPITSHQSAYDNPTFTKLVSYYANQPHVLLVDEHNNQNFNNDAILAKQKNLDVDKSSPLKGKSNGNGNSNHLQHQIHQMNDIHHHNGRQHLI